MLNLICRLCLCVTEDKLEHNLCDIFCTIRTCLDLDISDKAEFPNRICKDCFNKIEEINRFCASIKHNQFLLSQHLQNGTLFNYYTALTNQVIIKKENNNEHKITEDSKSDNVYSFKQENGQDSTVNEQVKESDARKLFGHNHQSVSIFDDELKNNDFHEIQSSDDEDNVTLSSLKEITVDILKTNVKKLEQKTNKNICKNILLENYNCFTCDEKCETQNELKKHYKEKHYQNNNVTDKSTFTKEIISGNTMYRCDKCKKIYTKKNMKRHLLYHSTDRPYVCKLCARTYKSVSDIIRHGLRAHSSQKFYCSYKCGFSTAYTGALKDHEDRAHKNEYKFKCEDCGKGFQVKTWYEQHQNIHTGLKPFVCHVCGLAFHMDKYMKTHVSSMHPQSLEEKRHICLHCNVKCDSVNSLSIHLQKVHGVVRSKTKTNKACLCDYCGKILTRPEQLKWHRRMHLVEKPYQCSTCNKSYRRKYSLRVHERVHTAGRARAHTCEPCGARYSQPSALYRHQRTHHGLPRKRA